MKAVLFEGFASALAFSRPEEESELKELAVFSTRLQEELNPRIEATELISVVGGVDVQFHQLNLSPSLVRIWVSFFALLLNHAVPRTHVSFFFFYLQPPVEEKPKWFLRLLLKASLSAFSTVYKLQKLSSEDLKNKVAFLFPPIVCID